MANLMNDDADAEALARSLVGRTRWSMAIGGQPLSDETAERLVKWVIDQRLDT